MGRKSKVSLTGFRKFVKDHLAGRALAVTALGIVLPAMGMFAAAKLNLGSMVSRVPAQHRYGQRLWPCSTRSNCNCWSSYLAYGAGLLGRNEAIMANSIALVLFGLNAMRNAGHPLAMVSNAVPSGGGSDAMQLFGYGGSHMSGYGGYLGYLGDAHSRKKKSENYSATTRSSS